MTYPPTSPLTSPTLERMLRPGWYLYWQKQIYQIHALHPDNLLIQVVNITTDEPAELALDALLTGGQDVELPLLAAPSLAALRTEIAAYQTRPQPSDETSLPAQLLTRADKIIKTVETVEQLLAQTQHRAQLHGETFRHTQSLQQVVQQLETPIAWPTFYKYRRLYRQSYGDRTRLAASLRRATFNQSKTSPAALHFLDTLILRYYARQRPIRPATLPPGPICDEAHRPPLVGP